ncbi:carbohydrate-binding protein [Nocardia sp. NPDC050435]|uniref:carbohydrate-binding protein n=1 Tax=Nocardia sp. NPDC050435 TaxID=3155040 RepID=UPI0033FA58EF
MSAIAVTLGMGAGSASALPSISVSSAELRVGQTYTITINCDVRSTLAVAIDVDPYSAEPGQLLGGDLLTPNENLVATVQWTPSTAGAHTIQAYGCSSGAGWPDGRPPTSVLGVTIEPAAPVVQEWQQGSTYQVGDVVSYQGVQYKCRQAHTAHAPNWTPPQTPALWQQV